MPGRTDNLITEPAGATDYTDWDDRHYRQVALECAVKTYQASGAPAHSERSFISSGQVLEIARIFESYLKG